MLWVIITVQVLLAAGIVVRMLRTARGKPLRIDPTVRTAPGAITVIVPVLNEFDRLAACLERIIASGPEVREILVVDGGSTDGTRNIIASFAATDARVRAVFAAPIPTDWNGKAWGLACGLAASSNDATWILTIDADVRVRSALCAQLGPWAERANVDALSIATKQELGDLMSGVIHPAMLATLVYRYGLPGNVATRPGDAQANGQCMLLRRSRLMESDVFGRARASICEDVTIARMLVRAGHRVGFYEAGDLASVRMHETWRGIWENWPRSLTLRDGISRWHTVRGLADVTLVQALPLVMLLALIVVGVTDAAREYAFELNFVLLLMRVGIEAGTRRAYRKPPWTYWLSIFADVPTAAALIASAMRRKHTWRGRTLVTSERMT